ncbi:MAG: hypothetical protein JJT76_15605 [Clostridiaceae bacterium]|nr:hypothetical protein [Clostridiaceae bacterium]
MKAEVRDDIIALDTFVAARFKYEKYIEAIHECGGYCFLDQFERIWKEEGGHYLAKKMEDAGLIKTKNYNNYKFVYLSDAALKYLTYKDDPKDFSDKPKNMIPVKKLKSTPSEKVLFFSAMKFHLIHKYDFLKKSNHLNHSEKQVNMFLNTQTEVIKQLQEKVQHLKKENNDLADIYHTYLKELDDIASSKVLQDDLRILESQIKELQKEIDGKLFGKSKEVEKLNELEKEKSALDAKLSMMNAIYEKIEKVKSPYFRNEEEIQVLEKKLKKLEYEEQEKKERVEKVMRRILDLHDRSKVIAHIQYNKESDDLKIQFIIMDTGSLKTPKGYWKLIYDLLDELGINVGFPLKLRELNIIYLTIDLEKRKNQFNKIHTHIEKMITMHEKDFNITKASIELDYMKKYKDRVQNKISYIKEKDIDTFEKLRETINKKTK